MFRESNKVVDSSIPQPHYGSQLCIDNLGISGRGRRGERFVVKDCSEEDETLRLRPPFAVRADSEALEFHSAAVWTEPRTSPYACPSC